MKYRASDAASAPTKAPELASEQAADGKSESTAHPNQGTLLVDATSAQADVAYPTDLNLLNEAREKLEAIIDTLHEPVIGQTTKPRTYREKVRKEFLAVSKQRRPRPKVIRKAIRRQLGYVGRNFAIIAEQARTQPLTLLGRKAYRDLLVIHELYRQQPHMYQTKSHQIEDRIVSIHQPHVRPIVRGKAKARVEIGAKIAVSMTKGYVFAERVSWDNFNESTTLIETIENYRRRFGSYPEVVQADQIYRTRENRHFCKQHGIRLSGPVLGRPPKDGATRERRNQDKKDAGERNTIEGKFGEGKRKYGLDRIHTRLERTRVSVTTLQLLVMNLEHRLRVLFCFIFVDCDSHYILVALFSSAHVNDGKLSIPLLKALVQRHPFLEIEHVLLGAGYYFEAVYQQVRQIGARPLIDYNPCNEAPIKGRDKNFKPVCKEGHSYVYDSFDSTYETLK